jgi:hypothetical protein
LRAAAAAEMIARPHHLAARPEIGGLRSFGIMIFSENRFPLFGIMLWRTVSISGIAPSVSG